MTFFLKKLNAHELGYRNGKPGGAGQFLLIPKNTIAFFPTLSSKKLNDSINITLNGVSLPYTYHNSKYSSLNPKEDRDEFRLYINSEIKNANTPFTPNDIILLVNTDLSNVFKMYYFPTTSSYYNNALSLLNSFPSKTAKLLQDSSLPILGITSTLNNTIKVSTVTGSAFASTVAERETSPLTEKELIEAFKEAVRVEKINRFTSESTSKIKRYSKFHDIILELYGFECCVTSSSNTYKFNRLSNLEAAHIIPKETRGGDHPSNGIALTRDLHWAFDEGLFTIDQEYKIKVHQQILNTNSTLNKFHGQIINLPKDLRAYPNKDALAWREKNIFGKFIN
jgi:HNH endonuclease